MPPFQLREAARLLQRGGILAYPTEAVFGLGCDPLNEQAIQRLLSIKQRPVYKGLILIGGELEHLLPYMQPVDSSIMHKLESSWPGPATWLVPAAEWVPCWLTGEHDSIALRLTAHPLAAAVCREFGGAIVSTSANLSSQPPARNALQTRLRCGNQVDSILSGSTGNLSSPTPIQDALSGRILRG